MIVVDSSVWIAHFRGEASPARSRLGDLLRRGIDVAITEVIYMELLRGVRTDPEVDVLRRLLQQTTILRLTWLADFELAAELYRRVRQDGHTVRQATDCMIAAVCVREDVPLLHEDADFDHLARVSSLRIA